MTNMETTNGTSHFKVIQQFKIDYSPASVTLYESARTGLRVVVANQPGPKIYGCFILATEIHDDSGAPHTLEHLIFMGSRSYAYKGLLDQLANRSYSNTNAWTATDHTAYTLESAGWAGFAQLLPVYLEHVLLPTLTDSACYTEVHHVDGAGNDAGVVYSEMQGVQNTPSELIDLRSRRLVYPEGDGFRAETGGLMENLRLLTADRIREFHRDMYQPKNLSVALIGQIDEPNLLQILDKFEDSVVQHLPSLTQPFERPWVDSHKTSKIDKSITETIEFPEEDESTGEVQISFLMTRSNDEVLDAALTVLQVYLSGSSISLLENILVETEHLASYVYASMETRPYNFLSFTLASVQTSDLEKAVTRFWQVLQEHAETGLNMDYIKDCIARTRRQIKLVSEDVADAMSGYLVSDHLFGNRDGTDLLKHANLREYDVLDAWSETQWREYFTKYLAHANAVTVMGKPSKKLADKIAKDELARVKAQQDRLGEEGLKRLQERLDQAKRDNEKPIPAELLAQFKLPSTNSVHFIPTETARSGLAKAMGPCDNPIQHIIDGENCDLPLFIHFEHVKTNFARIALILNTSTVPSELRPLLPVYISNFFDTPVMRDGTRVEYEDVVAKLEKDTIGYSIELGNVYGNPELLCIHVQLEPHKYQDGILWIRDLLFHSIFDTSRLESSVTKILADIPDEKREGDKMGQAVLDMQQLTRQSTARANSTLTRASYLRRIRRILEKSPETVIAYMEAIRSHLVTFDNFHAFVIGNFQSGQIKDAVGAWSKLTPSPWPTNPSLQPLDSRLNVRSDVGKNPGSEVYVVPMAAIDSSYGLLSGRGIESFEHPRYAALRVVIAYLNTTEGPLWNAVRGNGLAYGTDFQASVSSGKISCRIYRSPDAFKAYVACKEIVDDLASGKVDMTQMDLDAAISSIVTQFADEQPTMADACTTSFMNQVVRGVPKEWGTSMMKKVRAVTLEEARATLQDFIAPILQPGKSNLVITCATIMQEGLLRDFTDAGFKPRLESLSHFQDDYGIGGPDYDGDDDDSDDEDDEEDEDEDEDDDEDEDEADEP